MSGFASSHATIAPTALFASLPVRIGCTKHRACRSHEALDRVHGSGIPYRRGRQTSLVRK